jgi:phosphatidylglycerol:prolipoprotein diacylglycerol transferase
MISINVDPVAFTIGVISISWYGIMVALAVITLVAWALIAVKRGAKVTYDVILNAAVVGIPSGIIFSRLLHVIDFWDYYMQHPAEIIGGEGLSIYGAVLGATLCLWIYSRFSKQSFAYLADLLAPGIILAQAIGRVGCTLNGCCYGLETSAACSIVYTNVNSFGPLGIPVYPTQVFEIGYDLIVFGILLALRGKFRPDGSLFLIYLTFYALWRFGIDFIREGTPFLFGLHQAQVIALVVLTISITLLILKTRRVKTEDSGG